MDRRTFFVSTGIIYAGSIVGILCTIGFYGASLRIGTQAFGALQATMSLIFVLASMRSCVSSFVVVRTGGDRDALSSVVRRSIPLFLLETVVFSGLFILCAPLFSEFLNTDSPMTFVLIGLAFFPAAMSSLAESVLNVQQRFLALSLSLTLIPAFNLVLAILLFRDGYQNSDPGWIVLGSQLLSCINLLFVDWSFIRERPNTQGNGERLLSQLRTVGMILAASLLFGLSYRLDVMWARHMLSAIDAGSYAICASIATVVYMVSSSIGRVTSVSLRQEPTIKLVVVSYAIIIGISAFLASCFFVAGPMALRIISGHDVFIDWNMLLPLFVMAALFAIIVLDFSCLNVVTKKVHAGIGLILVIMQGLGLGLFGISGSTIAWTQMIILAITSLLFSTELFRAVRSMKKTDAHPAEYHFVQNP